MGYDYIIYLGYAVEMEMSLIQEILEKRSNLGLYDLFHLIDEHIHFHPVYDTLIIYLDNQWYCNKGTEWNEELNTDFNWDKAIQTIDELNEFFSKELDNFEPFTEKDIKKQISLHDPQRF